MNGILNRGGRVAVALALGASLLVVLAAPAAATDRPRPFLGAATGSGSIVPIVEPIPACPVGSMFYVTEKGTGTFAHLGLVHYTLVQCAAVNMTTGEGWTTTPGSITLVAANGDQLLLSHRLTFTATPMPVPKTAFAHLEWAVTGGTGRFAHATGSGRATWFGVYTADLSGAFSVSTWAGTIAY